MSLACCEKAAIIDPTDGMSAATLQVMSGKHFLHEKKKQDGKTYRVK